MGGRRSDTWAGVIHRDFKRPLVHALNIAGALVVIWAESNVWSDTVKHAAQGSRRSSLSSQPAMEMQDVFQPCCFLLAAQWSAIPLQGVQLLCFLMRTYAFNAEGA